MTAYRKTHARNMASAIQKELITEKTLHRSRLNTIPIELQLRRSDAEVQHNSHTEDIRGAYA